MAIPGYNTEFDSELIEIVLPPQILKQHGLLIDRWLCPNDCDELNRTSVELHRVLSEHYLRDKIDLPALSQRYDHMVQFENNIKDIKVGLGDKFYRDHLAHSVRVMLLMTYICKVYLNIADDDILEHIAISGLFHDIAYPLQEHAELVNIVSQSLQKSYSSTVATPCLTSLADERQASCFLALLYQQIRRYRLVTNVENESIVVSSLVYGLLTKNHGMLSAFELWKMLLPDAQKETTMLSSLLAIALHDIELFPTELSSMISLDKFPISFVLILSDELQEWNRFVFEKNRVSCFLSRLELSKNDEILIECKYRLPADSTFSPYLQLKSKNASLSRLKSEIPIKIEFSGFESILIASGFVGQRLHATVHTEILGDVFKCATIDIVNESDELILEYAVQTHPEAQLTRHFAEGLPLTQDELIFRVPIQFKALGDYQNLSGALYLTGDSQDMVFLLTKTKRDDWPAEIATCAFEICQSGTNARFASMNLLLSYGIPSGSDHFNFSQPVSVTKSNGGPIHFNKSLYHSDKVPYRNISMILVE